MATRKRPKAILTAEAGGIHAAGAQLGLSARESRLLVHLATDGPDTGALEAALADVLVERSLQHRWEVLAVRRLLTELAETSGVEADALALAVHSRAVHNPSLLALSPPVAADVQIRMLAALAPIECVSLWQPGNEAAVSCSASVGSGEPSRRARLAAAEALSGRPQTVGLLCIVPVLRWQRPEAVLVFRAAEDEGAALAAARETASALTPILEREALLARNAIRERALVSSGERLLTRVGFDLHDGPIQDVAALAGDIRAFKQRVEGSEAGPSIEILGGFLDDLQSRLDELDRGLRSAVHSLESPAVGRTPLDEALRREVETFRLHNDVDVELELNGSFRSLTDSQRIALIRIVQESLTNARDHGGARSVSVTLVETLEGLHLEIRDDGRGFDVPRTLVRAARRGRFGLVGMGERARLLGGRFDVQSRPGGPTVVSVYLSRWQPVAVAADQATASI